MTKEWDPEDIFEVLGSEHARRIIAACSLRPLSADELAEVCGTSLPTVYRRVNALLKYNVLREQTQINAQGNHFKTFETQLKRFTLEVEEGGFDIDIQLRQDMVDQFDQFWAGLENREPEE